MMNMAMLQLTYSLDEMARTIGFRIWKLESKFQYATIDLKFSSSKSNCKNLNQLSGCSHLSDYNKKVMN